MSKEFSLARLICGVSVIAVGMGLIANFWRTSAIAVFIGLLMVWAGIGLPFMRVRFALGFGLLMGVITFWGLVSYLVTDFYEHKRSSKSNFGLTHHPSASLFD